MGINSAFTKYLVENNDCCVIHGILSAELFNSQLVLGNVTIFLIAGKNIFLTFGLS